MFVPLLAAVTCRSAHSETIPNFTKGDKPGKQEWYLHLHGAVGHVYSKTHLSRQIYITKVPGDSQAREMLRPGDVILGISGKPFSEDALWTLRNACHAAREAVPAGTISFLRWRNGKVTSQSISMGPRPGPDLTKHPTIDRKRTYNLGATGLRGWIYTKPANFLASAQGRTTTSSRQILVTHVGKDSPADGVMRVDDVILGVNGELFSDDARQSLARAITDAEKEENKGILKLRIWRVDPLTPAQKKAILEEAEEESAERALDEAEDLDADEEEAPLIVTELMKEQKAREEKELLWKKSWKLGKTMDVELKLEVVGTYSEAAPWNCPKSNKILSAACKALEKEPLHESLWGAANALALMATGKPEYLPRVREFARKIGPPTLKLPRLAMGSWETGYRGIFLCEYYLLTGDKEVLHAVRQYTGALARGQSLYGTFGHGFSLLTADGKLHGSIPPYGPVNAAGLTANLAIALGQKCGLDDPEIDPAVERASNFFGYYVGKGSIPYGEHKPWPYHENNGKNAMSALLFGVQGNRILETKFWARMVTASYKNREYGHTGQGFSYLWGALGANAGGPLATAAFLKEALWHLDLVRRCDGSFTYDGGEQYGGGKTDDNTYYGKSGYYGLSPNACYVLTYSLPLKKLLITGRDANQGNWLNKQEVAEAVTSARFDLERKSMNPDQLIVTMADWSPIVRAWAADELAKRLEVKTMVTRLLALAEGKDARVAQGACETLGHIKDPKAIPAFIRLLSHEDRWLRFKAAEAIRKLGDAAKPFISDILKAVVETAEPSHPIIWDDPIQLAHGQLAKTLFTGPLMDEVKEADPKLLYPAIRAVANNADGMARAQLRGFFERKLTVEDVQALGTEILEAVKTMSPADMMYSNEIRMGAFKVLTKYRFIEGVEAGVLFAKTQLGHGSERRTGEIMKEIVPYGNAARSAIPGLRELIADFNDQVKNRRFPGGELNARRVRAVEEAIEAIEAAKGHPKLRSIKGGKEPRD